MPCPICDMKASHCECSKAAKEAWGLAEEHEEEIYRLKTGINYWAHCMWQGMLKTCPENKEELREFLASCGVEP